MAVKLLPLPFQYANNVGQPLSGGTLTFFAAGTTTQQAAFTDNTGTVQLANPLTLDSSGRIAGGNEAWGTVGLTYKVVVKDSGGTTLVTLDNLSAINDTTSGITSEWLPQSTPTFVSGTSFTVTGNQTSTFQVGMRVKATINAGFIYGTIATSVFTSLTTITLNNDSGSLDATLSAVSVGLLGETNPSVPAILIYNVVSFHAHRSTNQTSGSTVIWDTVDNQNGGTNYNSSTGVFTAPFTGWYLFQESGEVLNNQGGAATIGLNLVANGTTIAQSGAQVANAQALYTAMGSVVFLSATQTCSVGIINGPFSANYDLVGQASSSFSGYMIARTA